MKELLVGWNEVADLPELNISALPVKIDTGAKTSSLHAENIQFFKKDSRAWVRFETLNSNDECIQIEAEVLDKRTVKSSNGRSQSRYVIKTHLSLGGENWPIELTLADRSKMRFKMLLGRRAMDNIQVSPMQERLLG